MFAPALLDYTGFNIFFSIFAPLEKEYSGVRDAGGEIYVPEPYRNFALISNGYY